MDGLRDKLKSQEMFNGHKKKKKEENLAQKNRQIFIEGNLYNRFN